MSASLSRVMTMLHSIVLRKKQQIQFV